MVLVLIDEETDVCIQMFIAASFIIAKNRNNPNVLSIDKWINITWDYPYSGILFSNKRNEVQIHAMT